MLRKYCFRYVQIAGSRDLYSNFTPNLYFSLNSLSSQQIQQVKERDSKIREDHYRLNAKDTEDLQILRKRMIYRSKQRGWLEVDLLLGSWAAANVQSLTLDELREYEVILQEETINIYNYLSGKDPLPNHLQGLSIMRRIQDYAFGVDLKNPADYAAIKFKANLI